MKGLLVLLYIFLFVERISCFMDCAQIPHPMMKMSCEAWLKFFTAKGFQNENTMLQNDQDKGEMTEGFNKKCNEDPELFNDDDCGDWTWKKTIKGVYNEDSWKCRTIECLCPYFNGSFDPLTETCTLPSGKPLNKAIRQEYRTLTDAERHRFHNTINIMKNSGIWDEISMLHLNASKHHKHRTIAIFWNWHRNALKRYEIELRKIDPELAIPYWDSTLDQNLPVSRDSIMWTDEFMGRDDKDGYVISGPSANWITLKGTPLRRRPIFWGPLFIEEALKATMGETQINMPRNSLYNITCRKQLNMLFGMHGMPHHYIGGDLEDSPTATNDPLFLLHHGFVDLLWELWKQQKDKNCHIPGVLDDDSDETIDYTPRPRCTHENPNCGSPYLFCDRSRGMDKEPRCASKIKLRGSCEGLDQRDEPCHQGVCFNRKCVKPQKYEKKNMIDRNFA